jgi:hypothetical protein
MSMLGPGPSDVGWLLFVGGEGCNMGGGGGWGARGGRASAHSTPQCDNHKIHHPCGPCLGG